MSRIEQVIESVKGARNGTHRPWIYDENGRIKDEVICGEVLDLLEELKNYEIEVTDEWISKFIHDNDHNGYNTYNLNANISNDLNYFTHETEDAYIIVMAVHLWGDIRGGYSDYFAVKFDNAYDWFELESRTQHKMISDNLMVDIDLFSELYEVYDDDKGECIGSFYECEIEDLLDAIKEEQNKCTARNVEN